MSWQPEVDELRRREAMAWIAWIAARSPDRPDRSPPTSGALALRTAEALLVEERIDPRDTNAPARRVRQPRGAAPHSRSGDVKFATLTVTRQGDTMHWLRIRSGWSCALGALAWALVSSSCSGNTSSACGITCGPSNQDGGAGGGGAGNGAGQSADGSTPNELDAAVDASAAGGDAATGDAGPSQPTVEVVRSNTGNATFRDVSTKKLAVTMVASNLIYDSGSTVYRRWYAELQNTGKDLVCLLEIKPEFKNAKGKVLASLDGFVDGAPYKSLVSSSAQSLACIPPSGRGAVWTLESAPATVDAASITAIDFTIEGLIYKTGDAKKHPLEPVLTSPTVTDFQNDGFFGLGGTLTATTGTINAVMISVYPQENGLLTDNLSAMRAGALQKSAAWSFQTDTRLGTFADYLAFTSFSE